MGHIKTKQTKVFKNNRKSILFGQYQRSYDPEKYYTLYGKYGHYKNYNNH
jgi:hypothetical protein